MNNLKIKLCPYWPSCTLWLSFGWALGAALFAPADAPAQSLGLAVPPQLTNGGYLVRFSGTTGRVFEVQASTDLTQWTSIANLTNSTGQVEVLDTNPGPSARFYRAVAPLRYRFTVINPPPGYPGAEAHALNNAGQVAGSLANSSGFLFTGFFWDAGHILVLPPLPSFPYGTPEALSDTGRIVGFSRPSSGPWTATLWTRNGNGSFAVTNLSSLLPPDFGFSLSDAMAISPDGRFIAAQYNDPVTRLSGGAIIELDSAGALVSAKALELRSSVSALRVDNGILKITGSRTNGDGSLDYHAYLWKGPASPFNLDSDKFVDLNSADFDVNSVGEAISSKGEVACVGAPVLGSPSLALFWDESQQMVDMLDGQTVSFVGVSGINDDGYVVGEMGPGGGNDVAFLWHRGAPLQSLISLKSASDTSGISALAYAGGINNAGQILAVGYPNGPVSVLMNPE